MKKLQNTTRIDDTTLEIKHPSGVPITLFATEEVHVENDAVRQVLEFVDLQVTLDDITTAQRAGRIEPFWDSVANADAGSIEKVVLTPDFHKGGGIPVGTVAECRGFVIPQAVGNDICCGMRFVSTDVSVDELFSVIDKLPARLRHLFFLGGRDIPLSPKQREDILRYGLQGLAGSFAHNQDHGIWRGLKSEDILMDASRTHLEGCLSAKRLHNFGDWIQSSGDQHSRDSQIGSIGGSNHFVEIQSVDEVINGAVAHAWGVKKNTIAIMAHSGSVGLGHLVGDHFIDEAKKIFPKSISYPTHGFFVLPTTGPHAQVAANYLDALHNAANFAFINRFVLTRLVVLALNEALGREIKADLVYDAPHNLIWGKYPHRYIHRKGACPARGIEDLHNPYDSSYAWTGHPVIIPGSMGSSSWLLNGQGNEASLCSACHGAGRAVARGAARKVSDTDWNKAKHELRVVNPVDLDDPVFRMRRDIVEKYEARLKEEGPWAYKDVTPVIDTVDRANIAKRVAKMLPLLTIKG